ncbi:MAG: hypothetical protein HQL49_11200 [Gammaproteobacteria bacterium]|nr:hypothetical protein [Gammaproteobacteria bacterium]
MADSPLHPSIVAMVSLAANIAANHPKMGLCQLERLRGYGISEEQIGMVVDIARHLRDEVGEMLDAEFNLKGAKRAVFGEESESPAATACCTTTASGNACC